jgi:hypothetical protein
MTDIILNQLSPGGVMKQLADAAGGVSYNQYAPGGPVEQLRTTVDDALVLDQYASGGPLHQIEVDIEESEGGGAVGPLDLVSTAAFAYGNRALSAAKLGTALYTLKRSADAATQSFNSDATTGAAPSGSIVSFIGTASPRNGAISNGSDLIVLDDASGVMLGQEVSGIGIPDESFVLDISDAPTVQISNNATATNAAAALTFETMARFTIWKDQGAHGVDLDNGDQGPVWIADQANGHPAAGGMFNAQLFSTVEASFLTGDSTVFWVCKNGSGQAAGFTMNFNTSNDASFHPGALASQRLFNSDDSTEASAQFDNAQPEDVYAIWDGTCQLGAHTMRYNGAALSSTAVTDTGAPPLNIVDLLILATAYYGDGTLEVIAYPSILSDADRLAIRQNIAAYYGITLS